MHTTLPTIMETRSQKRTLTGNTTARGKEIVADKQRRRWSLADIDHIELDDFAKTYHVFLKWPDGSVTEHDRDEVYKKCAEQVSDIVPTPDSRLQPNIFHQMALFCVRRIKLVKAE